MMSNINNNAYEVDPSPRKKRKRFMQCTNAFLNPALDILSTEDRMCNNIMEVAPAKRSRRSRSCDSRVSFENPGLEFGNTKNYSNDLLRKELANVNKKLASILEIRSPIYQNNSFNHVTIEEKSIRRLKFENISEPQVNSTPVVNGGVASKRRASFDLSFIDKIGVNDDSTNGEALYLDDDLNESNIMEIKTIDNETVIKNPVILKSTNPFLNCQIDYDVMDDVPQVFTQDGIVVNNFPFDIPVNKANEETVSQTSESSYNASSEVEVNSVTSLDNAVLPRRLFPEDITDNSIQYMDDSSSVINDDVTKFGHSTLNEPVNPSYVKEANRNVFVFGCDKVNKQSKILGCDVSHLSQGQIFNCRTNNINSKSVSIPNVNNNIQATFKDNSQRSDTKHKQKNSKNIFSKIKEVFKHDKKPVQKMESTVGNPYEVFRKAPVQENSKKPLPVCFVNPALNLNTTDSEIEDIESTSNLNTMNTFKITPMKKAKEFYEKENLYSFHNGEMSNGVDLSDILQTENTIKKQVRFDTTLNHEKYITGNSFDSENHSSGSSGSSSHITQVLHHIDDQIEEYHNELDNCFNEKKIISQNL